LSSGFGCGVDRHDAVPWLGSTTNRVERNVVSARRPSGNLESEVLAALWSVGRSAAGRAHAYAPVLDDAGMVASRMRAVLDKGSDHHAVLSRFVGTLTPDEERTLAELLHRQRPSGTG
jgi:predicted transcriptional regulator